MEVVYCPTRLSSKKIVEILSKNPDLKRIEVPKSIFESVPDNLKKALEKVGVELVATGRNRGRPSKYSESVKKEVVEMYIRGRCSKDISKDLGIPLRTVYYILRKSGVRLRSRSG